MKDKSIKAAILFPILTILIIGISAMVVLVGISSYSTASKLSHELVDATVIAYANEFDALSTGANSTISAVAPIVDEAAANENPREKIIGILEAALKGNPEIISVWTCWEPNALDGADAEYVNQPLHDETGRFIPVIIRDGSNFIKEALSGYESPETAEYYFGAKNTGKPYITDPYEYVLGGKNTLLYTISIPLLKNGKVAGVVGADISIDGLMNTMNAGQILEDGYVYALSPGGLVATHRDKSLWLSDFRSTWLGDYKEDVERILANGGEHSISAYSDQLDTKVEFKMKGIMIGDTGRYWAVCGVVPNTNITASSKTLLILIIIGGLALIAIIGFVIFLLVNRALRALPDLTATAEALAVGDVSAQNLSIDAGKNSKNEIALLSRAFAKMAAGVKDQAAVLSLLARGDYSTERVAERSGKDIMNIAINNMVDNTNAAMREIQQAASQVASGAGQVADGAQALASGSTEQAATLQEFSASVAEIKEQAENSEKLALNTKGEILQAGKYVSESMGRMEDMADAMEAINKGSHEIVKIIKTIDEIAFQTNILALNAAVEAARAGQHGKGFAVVADEVRNLAGKSAQAARETADLIQSSVANVERGTATVAQASESMEKVNRISEENAQAMESLSTMAHQQAISISEINAGMSQISSVVQSNSATSEESAAAAEEMNAQSSMLNDIIRRFKLRDGEAPALGESKKLPLTETPEQTIRLEFGSSDKY
ncbi:methyl-accepting chemotaxis protein [Bacillota bacterium]